MNPEFMRGFADGMLRRQRVINVYDIETEINSGGMARVYRAKRASDGQRFAVKFPKKELRAIPGFRDRYLREGGLCRRVHQPFPHPHVIRLIDCNLSGIEEEFLVFELMVDSLLGRIAKGIGDDEKYRAILHASRGAQHLHSYGIIHRDIKPSNVLMARDGTYKLSDLGCAKEPGSGLNLTAGNTVGTYEYMPPEQRSPEAYADERSDIYALGATLHHLYFGAPPIYDRQRNIVTFSEKVNACDRRFFDLLVRMLHPVAARRFHSIESFIVEWQNLCAASVLKTPIVKPPPKGLSVGEAVVGGIAIGAAAVTLAAVLKALFGGKNSN